MNKIDFPIREVSQPTFSDQISASGLGRNLLSRRDALRNICATGAASLIGSNVDAEEMPVKRPQLCFDGEESHVVIPTLKYLGNMPITVQATINPDGENTEQSIFGNMHGGGLGLRLRKGYVEFVFHDGKRYAKARSNMPLENGIPVHIAGICDGRTVRLYIDSMLQEHTGMCAGGHTPSAHPFMLGADPDGDGLPQHFLHGSIEQLRVSSVPRDIIKQWHTEPYGKPDRFDALYYTLEDNDMTTLQDSSRWGHHGTMKGVARKMVDPKKDANK